MPGRTIVNGRILNKKGLPVSGQPFSHHDVHCLCISSIYRSCCNFRTLIPVAGSM